MRTRSLADPGPVRASALPVVPRAYHEFFRAPRNRWWKPLLGLAMFVGTWLLGITVVTLAAVFYDLSTGRSVLDDFRTGSVKITPMLFTANNLGLALAIPLAGLSAWAVFGQRPRWISSIHGGFRWGLFWRFGAVALAVGLLGLVIGLATEGVDGLRWNADSAFLIVAVLVTTPFQAAGEEYGVRGFLARSIGSWFSSRRGRLRGGHRDHVRGVHGPARGRERLAEPLLLRRRGDLFDPGAADRWPGGRGRPARGATTWSARRRCPSHRCRGSSIGARAPPGRRR